MKLSITYQFKDTNTIVKSDTDLVQVYTNLKSELWDMLNGIIKKLNGIGIIYHKNASKCLEKLHKPLIAL